MKTRYIIGVAGGSGSGKTTFANSLLESFSKRAKLLYQDNYYKDQSHKFDYDGGSVNFDHPDAIDFDLMSKHLKNFKEGQDVAVPIYDFATHTRSEQSLSQSPSEILIVDGILIFTHPELLSNFDLKVFISTCEQQRFERRLERDVRERGRSPQGVKDQFFKQVKPMHDQFVDPSKEHADFVFSGETPFVESLSKVVDHCTSILK